MKSGILKSFGRALAVASAALLVTSCFKDTAIGPNDNGGSAVKNGETTFIIDVPAATLPRTRAIEEGGEEDNAVHDLVFFLFDPDTHEYIEAVAANKISETDLLKRKKVTVPIPAGEYLAMVVANMGAYYMDVNEDFTEEQALEVFSGAVGARFTTLDEAIEADYFFGTSQGHTFADRVRAFAMSGYYNIPEDRSDMETVFLQRSLAKINVVGTAVKENFAISEIRVVNADRENGGYAFDLPPALLEDGETVSMFDTDHLNPFIQSPSSDCFASALVYELEDDQINAETNSCIDEIFLPETAVPEGINENDLRNSTNGAWKDAVAVLIKADLHPTDPSLRGRWFRVNLRMPDADNDNKPRHVNIVRNYSYTINITKAEGHGYATAKEAYDALPGDLIFDLVAIDDTDLNDFAYNGQYYLATGRLETFRSWESDREGGYKLVQDLEVYTDYPGGWKIENIVYPNLVNDAGNSFSQTTRYSNTLDWYQDWLIVETPSGTQGKGTIRVRVKPSPAPTHWLRPAAFDVVAGNLRLTVRAEQLGGGFLASPGVLGVGVESGKLTLRGSKEYAGTPVAAASEFGELADETVYVAYFKWGSLIASTSAGGHEKLYSPDDLVWAPAGFRGTATEAEALAAVKAEATLWYKGVPYRNTDSSWDSDVANGLGDPCAYAESGVEGKWCLPVGGTDNGGWNGGTFGGAAADQQLTNYWVGWGVDGHGKAGLPAGAVKGGPGNPDWSMFLPFTGGRHRNSINGSNPSPLTGDEFDGRLHNGDYHNQHIWARYWSGTSRSDQHGEYMHFSTAQNAATPSRLHSAGQTTGMFKLEGLAVRCVPWQPELTANGPFEYDGFAYDGGISAYGEGDWFTYPGDTLKITTDNPGGWKIESIEYSTGANHGTGWLTGIAAGDTGASGTTAIKPFAIDEYPYTESGVSARTATVTISAGSATTTVTIRQSPFDKFFAAPGMPGIKKSDFDALVERRKNGNPDPYRGDEIELTIRGSSTYKGTWVDSNIARGDEFIGLGGLADEPVYALYFKWGSMVAMIGDIGQWSTDGSDVVWVNEEFILPANGLWPYGGSTSPFTPASSASAYFNYFPTFNREKGQGDICAKITDNEWRIPSGDPLTMARPYSGTYTPFGTRFGRWENARTSRGAVVYYISNEYVSVPESIPDPATVVRTGLLPHAATVSDNKDLFIPAVGIRTYNPAGSFMRLNWGYYWLSSKVYGHGYVSALSFFQTTLYPSSNDEYEEGHPGDNGMSIRCVNATPPTP